MIEQILDSKWFFRVFFCSCAAIILVFVVDKLTLHDVKEYRGTVVSLSYSPVGVGTGVDSQGRASTVIVPASYSAVVSLDDGGNQGVSGGYLFSDYKVGDKVIVVKQLGVFGIVDHYYVKGIK
jgi:hypothetical protein